MSELALTGLVGSQPLGALAAFGLLRCCEELPGFQQAKLSWQSPEWTAVLSTDGASTVEQLIAELAARQRGCTERPELNRANNMRLGAGEFRALGTEAVNLALKGHRALVDFLPAFACEVTGEEEVFTTAFYMISGRQQSKGILVMLRELAAALVSGIKDSKGQTRDTAALFGEAIVGPWAYQDRDVHPLGWDPVFERLHALRARSPTGETPRSVAAAVWLAFEALPLFPCLLSDGHSTTRAFRRISRRTFFSWPVWEVPLTLCSVKSLLALEELTEERPPMRELRQRGVAAVFRSERYKVKTQGSYYILRPAFPCI